MSNNFTSFENHTKEETAKKTTINNNIKKKTIKVVEIKQNKLNIKNIINELNSPMIFELFAVILIGGALISGAILMFQDVEEKRDKHKQEMQEMQEEHERKYLDY